MLRPFVATDQVPAARLASMTTQAYRRVGKHGSVPLLAAGCAYPAVFLLPLVLVVVGAYLGAGLTRSVRSRSRRR